MKDKLYMSDAIAQCFYKISMWALHPNVDFVRSKVTDVVKSCGGNVSEAPHLPNRSQIEAMNHTHSWSWDENSYAATIHYASSNANTSLYHCFFGQMDAVVASEKKVLEKMPEYIGLGLLAVAVFIVSVLAYHQIKLKCNQNSSSNNTGLFSRAADSTVNDTDLDQITYSVLPH
ncbi:MAG: hypothetical protein KDH94_04620 [Coxiellaceae bacterium]|nr:hypothetical protein [Coxiellaceae bacterium]